MEMKKMRIIGVNGSPNAEGNTFLTIKAFLNEIRKEGFETDILHAGDGRVPGCIGCRKCAEKGECAVPDALFSEMSEKLLAADGVFLAAPVYFGSMPGQMMSFLDRFFFVSLKRSLMRLKVGASAAILRRTGGYTTIDDLNRYILAGDMVMVGQCIIHGEMPGEVLQDIEGLAAIRRLARNMAWVLKMKNATAGSIDLPLYEKRPMMNFIR